MLLSCQVLRYLHALRSTSSMVCPMSTFLQVAYDLGRIVMMLLAHERVGRNGHGLDYLALIMLSVRLVRVLQVLGDLVGADLLSRLRGVLGLVDAAWLESTVHSTRDWYGVARHAAYIRRIAKCLTGSSRVTPSRLVRAVSIAHLGVAALDFAL